MGRLPIVAGATHLWRIHGTWEVLFWLHLIKRAFIKRLGEMSRRSLSNQAKSFYPILIMLSLK
jgi:hypothetical protein